MKIIKLTKNKNTFVDDEDYCYLNKYKWCYLKGYAVRSEKKSETGIKNRKLIRMSREIMKPLENELVDHINHNTLDNRRCNLRVCNLSENMRNRKIAKNCKSGYKGVWWNKNKQRWVAYIKHSGRTWVLKLCKTPEEAALAYNKKAKELFGEFAYLNEVK